MHRQTWCCNTLIKRGISGPKARAPAQRARAAGISMTAGESRRPGRSPVEPRPCDRIVYKPPVLAQQGPPSEASLPLPKGSRSRDLPLPSARPIERTGPPSARAAGTTERSESAPAQKNSFRYAGAALLLDATLRGCDFQGGWEQPPWGYARPATGSFSLPRGLSAA